jgi:hypothetical protein
MTPHGRNWCRWEENIIFNIKEIGWNDKTGLIWLWVGISGTLL